MGGSGGAEPPQDSILSYIVIFISSYVYHYLTKQVSMMVRLNTMARLWNCDLVALTLAVGLTLLGLTLAGLTLFSAHDDRQSKMKGLPRLSRCILIRRAPLSSSVSDVLPIFILIIIHHSSCTIHLSPFTILHPHSSTSSSWHHIIDS